MTISIAEAIKQNTAGNSEGLPVGVPASYSWYDGFNPGADAPPANFTSVGGWGQVYPEQGSTYSDANAAISVANAQTWVHLKASNQWVQVQNQANDPIEGGHFVADFAGNAGIAMQVSNTNGTATMPVPPSGYNDHFWNVGRGKFDPATVDGVYVQMDMKISDPNMKVVANIGADWWSTPTANYVDGFANNPGAGMSNWVELTGQYKTLAFFSGSAAEFQANPPPVVTGAVVTNPPVVTDPSTGSGNEGPVVTNPTDPTTGNPTDPTPSQSAGPNLLKNGSFEATALAAGQVGVYGQVDGWTAQSGSKLELWNNVIGVKATDGGKFDELDYDTGRDGFSQTVNTAAGQAYTFSIDARTRPGENPNSCGVEVVWNGKVVSTIPPGADWKTFTVDVTGTGGNDTLTLREPANQSSDGVGALIDNLRLVAKTSSTSGPVTPTLPANSGSDGTSTPGSSGDTPVVNNPVDPTPSQSAGPNLLKNGSFEATALAAGQVGVYGQVDGWTAQSGSKLELWNNVIGVKATDGGKFDELDYDTGRDGFSQTVNTAAGQAYTFSIDARTRPGENPNSCGVEVVWNGKVVSTIPPGADWKTFTVDVTGTGGNDTLTLREPANQSSDGVGALIDNLRLVAKTPSTIDTTNASITPTLTPENTSAGGAPANVAAAGPTTSGASVPADVTAAVGGSHPFDAGSRTLGFSADAAASAGSKSGIDSGGIALFRQQLASAFTDVGALSGATPIHDDAAAGWGQALAQPRHT